MSNFIQTPLAIALNFVAGVDFSYGGTTFESVFQEFFPTSGIGREAQVNIRAMVIAFIGGAGLLSAANAFAAPPSRMAVDAENAHCAYGARRWQKDLHTFGSDTLQLHKAFAD